MELQDYEREHLTRLRASLAECTVLLKTDGSFPLKEAGELALYGSGARRTVKGGTGSGEVNSRFFVTAEQGLEEAGFRLTTKDWLDAYDRVREEAKKDFVKEIKARARKKHTNAVIEGMGAVMPEPEYELPLQGGGDTAVYVLARTSGEGNDRENIPGDIALTGTEIRDILQLQKQYTKFLLVLNVGGPVDLSPVLQEVGNVLLLSQLGVETGAALADILLGKANPSGKLATTWAAFEDYPTIGDFGDLDETRYREGIYVGYRYFDSAGVTPMFPFGFGLSYTGFEVADEKAELEGEWVTVTAKVKNTGAFPGKETLQVYASKPEVTLDQPFQTLAAFAKTGLLQPEEEETVAMRFRFDELASYDSRRACWVLEKGDYFLRFGTSSDDTKPIVRLRLEEEVVTRQTKNVCGVTDFADWKPTLERIDMFAPDVPILTVEPSAIPTETVDYSCDTEIDDAVKGMTVDELIRMELGAFDPKNGLASVIGSAGFAVAGAAGETCRLSRDLGLEPLVMADGPAGLRLSRDYAMGEQGPVPVGQSTIESMGDFLPKPAVWLMGKLGKKPAPNAEIRHQYATAIPIGTAIAQSWNTAFAELCGDIVGDEMERMNVDLWLAPALNIHRSIRCGRNFEYFSEDPLVSGAFAAAITKGVQAHPGKGTTVKHYAANNQEYNRYNNNSMVSERAMREIYLKGFEICVREAQPHALMTSYNLLNGTHTSEHSGLIRDILKCEFGYRGIVMTDWVVMGMSNKKSRYPVADAGRVAEAGGDLFMPGSKKDAEDIRAAINRGALTTLQLQKNVSRVIRKIRELRQK
ncbi:MAG: glycoside hydrolase family 3 C-terminal domain-containing protein [Oscillospiraceae bacterium]|nr:glycoside hydrolase family 3 C-terminal domain-containing protein [Oscillospiraceae bacterium]